MRAEILSVGTELLIGQVVNTNATYLALELAALGVDVHWVVTVGDNFERLEAAITAACGRADLVIVTGGLGPTADDITTEAIARVLGEPLVEVAEAKAHVEAIFKARNRPMAASNYKQGLFPPSARLIPNPGGTALGMAVSCGAAEIWTFPGVPAELKAMWQAWARPRLREERTGTIRSVLLRYVGIPEATLAERVAHLLQGENPSVAPYAGAGEVHLRVTAKAETVAAAEVLMAPVLAELRAIAPYYYADDDESLPAHVGHLLVGRGELVALAESCTGGLLASRLTDVPGASSSVQGGVVCYATEIKTGLLGVPVALVDGEGVVSRAVAESLAERVRKVLGAEWGVGVTGWIGDAEGVPDGDAGLVWIGVSGPDGTTCRDFRYGDRAVRESVKLWATQAALDMLRRRLNGFSVHA